jgi:hypothetical protein
MVDSFGKLKVTTIRIFFPWYVQCCSRISSLGLPFSGISVNYFPCIHEDMFSGKNREIVGEFVAFFIVNRTVTSSEKYFYLSLEKYF